MVDKEKVIVILLIVAILFSVISAVVTLSAMNYKPVAQTQPKVVYSGDAKLGNPNGGVNLYIEPQQQDARK